MIKIDFSKLDGLVPVIAQDWNSKEVLMLAYMNSEAWSRTIDTGFAHYYSRSRNSIWKKGETSGHVQIVKQIRVDCDNDSILLMIAQKGDAACHTGHRSCFYQVLENGVLVETGEKVFDPDDVY